MSEYSNLVYLIQNEVFQSVASKVDFNIWDNVTYKDNLIKVEVYYEEFNFEDISQSPAYEVSREWWVMVA